MANDDNGIEDLRKSVVDLKAAVNSVRENRAWRPQEVVSLPAEAASWNFTTFEKYINQRFTDLGAQLSERSLAQQIGVTAALAAAEKAVNAALIAAEKAVDKAEGAQQLRNEAQNEFRKSLSDLSGLMWTTKEGQAAIDSMRREFSAADETLTKKLSEIDSRKEVRILALEAAIANIQGRIWAISAAFAVIGFLLNFGWQIINHKS
jgi:hypothetical protein